MPARRAQQVVVFHNWAESPEHGRYNGAADRRVSHGGAHPRAPKPLPGVVDSNSDCARAPDFGDVRSANAQKPRRKLNLEMLLVHPGHFQTQAGSADSVSNIRKIPRAGARAVVPDGILQAGLQVDA